VTWLPRRSRIERWDRARDFRVSGRVRGESPLLGGEDLGEGGLCFLNLQPSTFNAQHRRSRRALEVEFWALKVECFLNCLPSMN
jgi:hypothetical protein